MILSAAKKLRFAILATALLVASACTETFTGEEISSELNFNVAQETKTASTRSHDGQTQSALYTLVGENSSDTHPTLYLHSTITDGICTANEKEAVTRNSQIESINGLDGFKVYGYMKDASNNNASSNVTLYVDDIISRGGSGENITWNGTKIYYWPGEKFTLDFFAYAPSDVPLAATDNAPGFTPPVCPNTMLKYTIPSDVEEQKDLMISIGGRDVQGNSNQPVSLSFKHLLTAVKFSVGSNFKGTINSITINGVYNSGTFDMAANHTDANGWKWNLIGNPTSIFSQTLNTAIGAENSAITSGVTTFMMLPQTLQDGAEIVIEYTNNQNITKTISADINGTSWPMGKTVNYKISLDHGAVDLGHIVDRGGKRIKILWAEYNVGASWPGDYGDYFRWGETVPYTSSSGSYGPVVNGQSIDEFTYGVEITPECDAATVNWGGTWRMPTPDELQWLINNCIWDNESDSGYNIAGYTLKSKIPGYTDKSIFLSNRRDSPSMLSYRSSTSLSQLNNLEGIAIAGHFGNSSSMPIRAVKEVEIVSAD